MNAPYLMFASFKTTSGLRVTLKVSIICAVEEAGKEATTIYVDTVSGCKSFCVSDSYDDVLALLQKATEGVA